MYTCIQVCRCTRIHLSQRWAAGRRAGKTRPYEEGLNQDFQDYRINRIREETEPGLAGFQDKRRGFWGCIRVYMYTGIRLSQRWAAGRRAGKTRPYEGLGPGESITTEKLLFFRSGRINLLFF